MTAPARPADEAARLEALSGLEILGTGPEAEFDALTRLAAQICGTRVSVVSLVDANVVWAKSNIGLDEHFPPLAGQFFQRAPRDLTFCAHAILKPEVMEVDDTAEDPRFSDNPAVTGEPHIRFYAGAPLTTPEGHAIGTLCVMDTMPHHLSPGQLDALQILSRQVVANLRARARAKDLDIALKAAQGLAEQRSDTLAFLSHELRNALGGLLGLTESWMEGREAPDASTVEFAHACAHDVVSMLNNVLDHAKSEAGQMRLDPRPFELRPTLERTLALARPRARAKGLDLSLELAPDLPDVVIGDAPRLHQIWLNLLGNALKFTESGGIRMKVRRGEGDRLAFEVIDTGIGIPADQLSRLFQPFQQASADTYRRFGGSGLGLAICHQLAVLMGGTLSVDSAEERGSTFTLNAPLPEFRTQELVAAKESEPLRILVAEDNAMARSLLKQMLEADGHAVKAVPTGEAALMALQADGFDLVLMDCRMPVMDGFEATEAIRRLEDGKSRIPVLGLTGNSMEHEFEHGRRCGMNAHLVKPLGIAALREAIRAWAPR